MFEKEAEEYTVLNARQYIHNEDIGFCTSEEEVRQAYQKGAEFGYSKAMNEAKGIIKDLLHCLPKENIEGVYEVTEAAEQFLSEVEK